MPRWVQLVTLPVALPAIWGLARAAGGVLLFIVAAVIALILNPMVTMLQRARLLRGVAVPVVYLFGVMELVPFVGLLFLALQQLEGHVVAREAVLYLRRHLLLEPWNTPTVTELGTGTLPRG